jgi:hypothetical protein
MWGPGPNVRLPAAAQLEEEIEEVTGSPGGVETPAEGKPRDTVS